MIGREIVRQFKNEGCKVISIDIKSDADVILNIADIRDDVLFDIDIFVNSSYPVGVLMHLESFLNPATRVAEIMAANGGGAIVNIASIYGIIGGKTGMYHGTTVTYPSIGYSAVKGAIISMTRALACKHGPDGVRVNCVSPGGVFDYQDPEFVKRYCDRVPLRYMATAENVADAVLFLASDKASYITGHNLVVDGGITVQ